MSLSLRALLCLSLLATPVSLAAQDTPEAQYAQAMELHEGLTVTQNFVEAALWLRRAAEAGYAPAQNQLGRYYATGLGVAEDYDQALHWLSLASAQGAPAHVFDHAQLLESSDPEEAARLYQKAADAGHLEAQVNLGVMYQNGVGVAQDFTRALALYEPAAEAGHARALNNLGLLYVRGTGVAQNYEQAAGYFAAAAEQGLSTAMTNLGVLYENGFGVPLDETRAAELYRAAASDARPVDQLIYDPRLQLPVADSPEAQNALAHAARAGDPIAQFQLGWLLASQAEAGFQQDQQAAELFRRAAENGHGPAMANLGLMYFTGRGLHQDYVLGQMWLLRAARSGVTDIAALSAPFQARMTADQINAAQLRAAD